MIYRLATSEDAEGKGYVHHQSWMETYTGWMDPRILDAMTLEKCVKLARNFPENTWIAIDQSMIVGFSCFMISSDKDVSHTGEVRALYVLKSHQHQGIGKALMHKAMDSLSEFSSVSVWVLSTNKHAIRFYESMGFIKDDTEKDVMMGTYGMIHEIRMMKNIR